jgi:restriction endonuclease Mrr
MTRGSTHLPEDDDPEMVWESHARHAVEQAIEDVQFDEVRGVVYLSSGEDYRFNRTEEGFSDYESILDRLTELARDEWVNYVPFDGGEPLHHPHADGIVEAAIAPYKFEDFFDRVARREDDEEIITSRDLILPRAGVRVEIDLKEINEELVRHLARHPSQLHQLPSRTFEELVAELFRAKGYQVEVTKRTRDGGLDIRAAMKSDIGTVLILIECKRFSPQHKVGVHVVRGLYGVVEAERATKGLVATTSAFTKDAKSFQSTVSARMHLTDFQELQSWLNSYRIK